MRCHSPVSATQETTGIWIKASAGWLYGNARAELVDKTPPARQGAFLLARCDLREPSADAHSEFAGKRVFRIHRETRLRPDQGEFHFSQRTEGLARANRGLQRERPSLPPDPCAQGRATDRAIRPQPQDRGRRLPADRLPRRLRIRFPPGRRSLGSRDPKRLAQKLAAQP